MKKALITTMTVLALSGCASNLKQSADIAVGADLTTTAAGIASGIAVEGNPLLGSPTAIVASGVMRVALINHINTLPEPTRTQELAKMNAITWGISISNLAVMAAASNPIGLAAGLIAGWAIWKNTEDEREFANICAFVRQTQPEVKCIFKGKV